VAACLVSRIPASLKIEKDLEMLKSKKGGLSGEMTSDKIKIFFTF